MDGKGPFFQGSVCQHSHLLGVLAEARGKVLYAITPSVLCLQVVLLGIDIISALVSRLQDRFKAQIGTGKGSVCVCGGGMSPLFFWHLLWLLYTKVAFSPEEHLGGSCWFQALLKGGRAGLFIQLGREQRGCATVSFLWRDLDVHVFFPQCCQVYLIGWETLKTQ